MPEHETDTIHCDRYGYNGKQKGGKSDDNMMPI
jgi:hypothetical protein